MYSLPPTRNRLPLSRKKRSDALVADCVWVFFWLCIVTSENWQNENTMNVLAAKTVWIPEKTKTNLVANICMKCLGESFKKGFCA